MPMIRWTTTLATAALMTTGGLVAAPAAFADGPDTPDRVIAEIEALEWPEYGVGDRNPDIVVASYLLRYLGYFDDDGKPPKDEFTKELEDAVREYQTAKNVDVPETGRLDQETWDNLRKTVYGNEWGQGTSGDPVCAVQHSLIHDYDKDIAHDCKFGSKTSGALEEVQEQFKIDPDGLVGVVTFRALVAGGA